MYITLKMPWTSTTSFCFNLNWINSKLRKMLKYCLIVGLLRYGGYKIWGHLQGVLRNKKPVTDYQGVSEHQRKTCSGVKS